MPENRDTDIILRILFADAFGIMHRTPVFFCNDYDTAVLALAEPSADELLKLVYVSIVLRYDGGLGPGGNGTVLCKKTRIAAHHFDKEYAVMGSCGVADLVHALHYGIERRIISYGGIRSVKVIVYRSRQSYARDIEFLGEYLRTGKRAVSSYDDQGIDTVLDHIVISFLPASEEDFSTEYSDLIISVDIVDSVADAADFINKYDMDNIVNGLIGREERCRFVEDRLAERFGKDAAVIRATLDVFRQNPTATSCADGIFPAAKLSDFRTYYFYRDRAGCAEFVQYRRELETYERETDLCSEEPLTEISPAGK